MGKIVSTILDPITGAGQARDAANQAAASQRDAATAASYASQFRPVGMTTAFGTSQFTREIDPKTGMPYVSSASYTANPQLAALQNQLMGSYGSQLDFAKQQQQNLQPLSTGAAGLFGSAPSVMSLGQQYLATSPQQAASDWYNQQVGLLAGGREQQLAGLRNKLFQTGRTGLATGGTTTGMAATNPELAAYYNSLSQENRQLAAQADQYGMERARFGAGLLRTAGSLYGQGAGLLGTQSQLNAASYSPLQTLLGLSGNVEQMSLQPYQLGIQLGQAAAPGQAAGAQMYNQGFGQAAGTQYAGAQNAANLNASFLSSLIGSAAGGFGGGASSGGGMFNGFGNAIGNAFGNPLTAMRYGTNLGSQQTRMLAAQDNW